MSEPKRYKVGKIGTTEMIDCVSYDDYARLKAEVERLTKAGDAMRESIICGTSSDDIQAVLEWDAAKEGEQP